MNSSTKTQLSEAKLTLGYILDLLEKDGSHKQTATHPAF